MTRNKDIDFNNVDYYVTGLNTSAYYLSDWTQGLSHKSYLYQINVGL